MQLQQQLQAAEAHATGMRTLAAYPSLPCVATPHAREADSHCAAGLPGHRLMLRAGVACGKWLAAHTHKDEKVLFLCGAGNNGGDGLIAAAWLQQQHRKVEAVLVGKPATADASWAMRVAQQQGVAYGPYGGTIPAADRYVDAIIGRGLKGALRQPVAGLLAELYQRDTAMVSIDMPAGWGKMSLPDMHLLAMLAVDPCIGTVAGEELCIPATVMAKSWFADLGVGARLQDFSHTRWLAPVAV